MKVHLCEQKSPEWHEVRKGKMTASHATAIGNHAKGLETYITKMMSEYYSSGGGDMYINADMERGNELEPIARSLYEFENDLTVDEVGFIEHDEYVGASPDGLVGKDGGIEIKSINDLNYFLYLLNGEKEISSDYIWQSQMNLLISKRKWWDLILYNPNYKKSMLVFRIYPDLDKFKELEIGFKMGIDMIKSIKSKIE